MGVAPMAARSAREGDQAAAMAEGKSVSPADRPMPHGLAVRAMR
jgi:hypothetical protein